MADFPSASGGVLSSEQLSTLKYFKYNTDTNELEANRTLSTEPATVKIGNHAFSSGGENVFFTNLTSNIDWATAWAGLKDQSILANKDHTGIIPPSFRHYGDSILDFEPDGLPHASIIVDYDVDSVVNGNSSIFGQETILGEDLATDDWLLYEVRVGTSADPVIYQQRITGNSLTTGSVFMWDFDHPVEGREGTPIHSSIKIAKGSQDAEYNFLKVRASINDNAKRYVKVFLRTFADEDVLSGTIFTNADVTLMYAATYPVDTQAGGVALTVDSNMGYNSFTVFDANQQFHPSRPCTVSFGGTQGDAVLQTKNDSYLFYKAPTGVAAATEWWFLDLNTKNGGKV